MNEPDAAIATAEDAGSPAALKRSLGLTDVTLFFVVAASNLQWVAAAAATGASSLIVWLIGAACMFVPLSLVVVFLSARYPEEGGLYVWSKRAFGPFAGFLSGWTYWTSNLPYFPALLYFMAGNMLFFGGSKLGALSGSPAYFISVAIVSLGVALVLNILGLDIEKWLNNVGAASRWIVTIVLVVLGALAWKHFGFATPVTAATVKPTVHVTDLVFWSTIAFAWTGPEAISFMGGEVKRPRRTIATALALAAPAIAIIYIGGTGAVLATLKPNETNALYGVMQSIGTASTHLGWTLVTPIAAGLVAVSCLASAGAWLGAVARLPFVAGLDRYLPKAFGKMHPRFKSPVVALCTQAAIAALFIFLGQGGMSVRGAYAVLVSMTVISSLLPFLLLFASGVRLSGGPRRPEDLPIPGGRWTIVVASVIGFFTTLGSIALTLVPPEGEPNKALAILKILGLTAVMVGIGILFYVSAARRKRRLEAAESAA
jgi:amino acid transporter